MTDERPATTIKNLAEKGLRAVKDRQRTSAGLIKEVESLFFRIHETAAQLDATTGTNERAEPFT